MSNKPIIDIAIDDSQFREFYEMFQEYEERLAEMPEDWRRVDDTVRKAEKAMAGVSGASASSKEYLMIAAIQADAIAKGIDKATTANKSFAHSAKEGYSWMSKTEKSALNVAKSVFDMGKWLLKLGAIGGGVAGLGGIVGTMGMRELARGAVSDQREARGVGVTTGQYKAFSQDFGRYVDPSILNKVSNAQNSYEGRMWLGQATGFDQNRVTNESPDQLAIRVLTRAHEWWQKTTPEMRTEENMRSTGFSQSGMSLEDMRRIGNTPIEELRSAGKNYGADQGALNVSDKSTNAWYEFENQLQRAGNTIETALTTKLSELAPSLSDFSKSLTQDASKLINDILTPENLKGIEDGISSLTSYLGSPQCKEDIKSLAASVSSIASGAKGFAELINKVLNPFSDTPAAQSAQDQKQIGAGLSAAWADVKNGNLSGAWEKVNAPLPGAQPQGTMQEKLDAVRHGLNMPLDPKAHLAELNKQYGLPAGTLEGMWKKESSEGKNLTGPKLKGGDQAIGDFQFTAAAWKDWGKGGDRLSFNDEADAAGRYMSSLQKQYKGNIGKALAAYNWGPGNVNKAVADGGENWNNRLPNETANYLAQILSEIKRQNSSKPALKVTNSTSAQVAMQANAAGL
ncbi:lytic transglycosylase, catalytic [Caballeronia calidae]|uniref:Lytic transglycosylase, catalytic n=1 Tax=Caballeronia calidae TaxID=1777139 RepID=A0A158A745_9BURK|nr:transglycosylase SLT domain-containing protein [Caballeronia calidae]SAK53593.1 lytic transglycosylase, catalytic [Caballeronia calidae]